MIGEILGGVILGPSVLGNIPGFTQKIFPQYAFNVTIPSDVTPLRSLDTFIVAADLGLILFMFVMGLELRPDLLARTFRKSLPISVASIVIPFGVGSLCTFWWYDLNNEYPQPGWVAPDRVAFTLFAGTCLSFTAFAVLCAILKPANLLNTELGSLVRRIDTMLLPRQSLFSCPLLAIDDVMCCYKRCGCVVHPGNRLVLQ